ncbi:MarR family winged helix-turn-helix transcriptional regulator [Nakamurella deserti]|uniref:MarR family winged helix-turn-helix transcriptional regulator n=1 Tax=Nakamurella deserti TaxID=2164074 RepID=UPI000DBE5BF6|nr:MarR family winged helix-turn-helix transcriptional regulator [Nakamurella deserti]
MDPDPPEHGGDTLPDLFWSVARAMRHGSRESLAPYDISPSHARAVAVLARGGPMRLSGLSDHLRIAPRSTTEVVDQLQDRGLVVRSPDPHDRRATLVSLTDAGADVAAAVRAQRHAQSEEFFGVLEPADRDELARILRLLRG